MNESILIAMIGLSGVLVGGVIQIIGQRFIAINQRANDIRLHVQGMANASARYATRLRVAAYETDTMAALHASRPEVFQLDDELAKQFDAMTNHAIALVLCSDHKVSFEASRLQHIVTEAHNTFGWTSVFSESINPKAADAASAKIMSEVGVILNMVAPRVFSRHLSFRRAETVRRRIRRDASKESTKVGGG